MEQTNLVVTPDGKTWDEVTRDTSYIGNMRVVTSTDTEFSWSASVIFDEWRGYGGGSGWMNKNFAIAYDRMICLVDGQYKISRFFYGTTLSAMAVSINGAVVTLGLSNVYGATDDASSGFYTGNVYLKRGDIVTISGENGPSLQYNYTLIEEI